MPLPVDLSLGLFTPEIGKRSSERATRLLLRALAAIDLEYLHEHPDTPHPYKAGIVYVRERETQHWLSIPQLLTPRPVLNFNGDIVWVKGGDCKDLSTAMVAWYYLQGERMAIRARQAWQVGDFALAAVLARRALILKHVRVHLINAKPGTLQYHVQVLWPDGRIEDPSILLGMGRNGLQELPPEHPLSRYSGGIIGADHSIISRGGA